MNKNSIVIMIVVAVLVGAVAFYGGTLYQKSQRGAGFGANGTRRFGAGAQGANGGQVVRGEVLSNDGKTVTVKLQDGSTKLVLVSNTTMITEATKATESAVSQGKQVMVFGTSNPDGSVGAQNIQLNPLERMGGARPTGQNTN